MRETVVVGPKGRIELPCSDLVPGTTVQIVVSTLQESGEPVDREALVARMRALRDKAIVEGMETWDIGRVNAEVRARRCGDCDPD